MLRLLIELAIEYISNILSWSKINSFLSLESNILSWHVIIEFNILVHLVLEVATSFDREPTTVDEVFNEVLIIFLCC